MTPHNLADILGKSLDDLYLCYYEEYKRFLSEYKILPSIYNESKLEETRSNLDNIIYFSGLLSSSKNQSNKEEMQ